MKVSHSPSTPIAFGKFDVITEMGRVFLNLRENKGDIPSNSQVSN